MLRKQKRIFTLIMLMAPFLSLYSTTVASVTYYDITLMLLGAGILLRKRKLQINKEFIGYGIMIGCQFLISLVIINDNEISDIAWRMLRYLFYVLFLGVFSMKYFDTQLGERYFRGIAVIASLFLFLQLIVYRISRYYIPGFFTFLPLSRVEMYWHAINYQDRYVLDPRPRSFFSEPQIFASFALGYLAILLFQEHWGKREKIILFILSGGIIASKSTTAILCFIFLWCIFFIKLFCKRKMSTYVLFILCAVFVGIIVLLPLYSKQLAFGSHSMNGRLGAYSHFFRNDINVCELLFGHGMVNIDSSEFVATVGFMPSVLRAYYYYGLVGLCYIGVMFIVLFRKVQKRYRMLVLLNVIFLIGTVDFFGIMLFVNMPFILSMDRNGAEALRYEA